LYHYSQRLSWSFSPNPITRHLLERRNRDKPIVDLTNSNPSEVFDNYPHAEIADAFSRIDSFRYEPEPLGAGPARLAVSRYYASRAIDISPEWTVLTASTSEAYAILFKLFCNPADQILVPSPSYPLFEFLAQLESVCVENYRLQFDGSWYIDLDHLRRQITSRTRAIVVVDPNNPTGSFLKQSEFGALAEIASQRQIPIICDEVFLDYAFGFESQKMRTLIGRNDVLSFSLNGLSKSAGMPQMKLGWIVINGPERERAIARERLELITDTYLSVGTPVQKALPRLFEIGTDIRRRIAERTRLNLSALQRIMRDGAAQPLHCEGGWSAIVRLPATQSEESWTLQLLNECGVVVQPGYFFDMASEPYVVVSLISRPGEFECGIGEIHRLAATN
jgi:alanine-synthesizing transaminase